VSALPKKTDRKYIPLRIRYQQYFLIYEKQNGRLDLWVGGKMFDSKNSLKILSAITMKQRQQTYEKLPFDLAC
jgi:hypothetical protein